MSFSLVHLHGFAESGEETLALEHRMYRPLELLGRTHGVTGAVVGWQHPDAYGLAVAADVTVLHNLCLRDFEAVVHDRRRRGRHTLVEMGDDLTARRPWQTKSKPHSVSDRQAVFHLASIGDGVQFSSPALEAKYSVLHGCRAVLPNVVALPAEVPGKPERFTVGWAGSSSHRADLEAIAPVVVRFCRAHPEVLLAVKGDPAMLAEVFAGVPAGQLEMEPFGPMEGYSAFLRRLHVGLAPLRDTAFNRGRTELKAVEYGAAGAVVVEQDAEAFAAVRPFVLSFADEAELEERLEACYRDRGLVTRMAGAMLEHLRATRGEDAVAARHAAWYGGHVRGDAGRVELPAVTADPAEAVAALAAVAECADREGALRSVLERWPGYELVRLRLVRLLVADGRLGEALEAGRPLLRSRLWHDAALGLLRTQVGPEVAAKAARYLRSGLLRAEMAPRAGGELRGFFERLRQVAPMHYFLLGYLARSAGTEAERAEARVRLGLYADGE